MGKKKNDKRYNENKDQSNTTLREEFEDILKAIEEKSGGDTIDEKKYKDLIKGRFKVTVTRIENERYEDSIYGKAADFTSKTIKYLIEKGKDDTRRVLGIE